MNKKKVIILSIILIILITAKIVISINFNKYSTSKAEKYFANNQIEQAQEYLEYSFNLGLKDLKLREKYVDSLISMPPNIKVQEKLANFLNYPIDDCAKYRANYYLETLQEKISKSYPNNYIMQAAHNQKILRWSNIPITYGFEHKDNVPDYYIEEIEKSFNQWQKLLDKDISFARNDKNPNILISFIDNNKYRKEQNHYVVAYTSPDIVANLLKRVNIKICLQDIENNNLTPNQIHNASMHEIMHALGFMGHSDNKKDLMYISVESGTVSNDLRLNPSEADINTLKLLYKIKPEITNSLSPQGEYLPRVILGSQENINDAKIREAQAYIKKAPQISLGYVSLAEGYFGNKQYSNAIKNLQKALSLATTNDEKNLIYYNMSIAYLNIGDSELAEQYVKRAMRYNNSAAEHCLLADIYIKEGRQNKAIREYKILINNDPHNIEYAIALANVYINNKMYRSARWVLKNYLAKNPTAKNTDRFNAYGILAWGL